MRSNQQLGRTLVAGSEAGFKVFSLDRQLRWYIGLRLVIMTSLAVPYYAVLLTSRAAALGSAPRFFGQLFGITCALTLVYIGTLYWLKDRPQVQAYLQFAGDLLLVTGLLYRFGPGSPFSPLYLVIIIVASAMLGRRAGLIVATAASVLHASLQLSFAFGWLVSPTDVGTDTGLTPRLLYSLFVNMLGFYAVAFLTSRLTSRALSAEGALEEHREDLADLQVVHRDVIESIPSGLITTDLAGTITTINKNGRRILGLSDEEVVGRRIDGASLFTSAQWQEFTASSAKGGSMRSEVKLPRSPQPLEIGFSISRLTDSEDEQRGYIVIFQDLTPWRKLEEEVRIKDRMAAVGELAAGLAHEIGNPLAAISGSVQMLAQASGRTESEKRLLDILLKESLRLDRTIKGFLRFARPRDRSSVHFDIAALLAENVALLRNSAEVGPAHVVELTVEPASAKIAGDPDQISQIFWNLARNALKAMPRGGTLKIFGRLESDRYAMRFVDTGRGMSDEERANLFHPFQSFFDSGTGIGMAIVYRIVQEHGGDLSVESSQGQGTTITVELPAHATLSQLVS